MVDKMSDLAVSLDEESTKYGFEYEKYQSNDSSCLLFKVYKYSMGFFSNLKQFFDDEKFCDIKITSKSNASDYIKAHKIILSSASLYFRAMFAGGFRENLECQEIFFEQENFESIKQIINFIYTAKIVVRETNVQNLLQVAKMLQMEDIVNACCTYLFLNMDANNCIGIEEFAIANGCLDLAKKAQVYLNDHFYDVSNSEEFFNLERHQLCKIIKRDDLKVKCESIVFMAVVKWVKHKPRERRCNLDRLFQCVRVHCLPPKFLKNEMKDNEIFNCEIFDCEEANQSKQYLQQVFDDLISHKPNTNVEPRRPNLNFGLYVVGGYQRQSTNIVECFKQSTGTWERCADMRVPRSGVSCVSLALYIYAIGGRNNSINGNIDCADVECYDPMLNVWRDCCPMSKARSRAGTAVIDNLIYVVGGAQGSQYHSSVERYSFEENRWENAAPMQIARIGLGCAVVSRLLYAIGGYNGTNRLNDVECYNPDQDSWYKVSSMNVPRSGAGVCSLDNYIYAIGGYTTNLQLNSAERYDTIVDQWTMITANLSSPRSALSCVAWNGKIYAIGGYDGNEFLSTVEYYDPKENKWTEQPNMIHERSGHGSVVTVEFSQTSN